MKTSNRTIYIFSALFAIGMLTFFSSVVFGNILVTDNKEAQSWQEFRVYNDNGGKYTFRYPESWHTYELPGMSYMRLENMDARLLSSLSEEARRQYFKIFNRKNIRL